MVQEHRGHSDLIRHPDGVRLFLPGNQGSYLRGGLGLAVLSANDGYSSDSDRGSDTALARATTSLLARKTALTPYANWMFGSFDGGGANVIQLGMAVNFY